MTDDHPLAIGHRRRRTMRVRCMMRIGQRILHPLLPPEASGQAVEGHQSSLLTISASLGDKNAGAPDDGGRIPGLGQLGTPLNVIGSIPADRKVLFLGSPILIRPPPGGPVSRLTSAGAKQSTDHTNSQKISEFHDSVGYRPDECGQPQPDPPSRSVPLVSAPSHGFGLKNSAIVPMKQEHGYRGTYRSHGSGRKSVQLG